MGTTFLGVSFSAHLAAWCRTAKRDSDTILNCTARPRQRTQYFLVILRRFLVKTPAHKQTSHETSHFLLALPLLMTTLNAAPSPDLLNIPVKDIAGKDTTLAALSGKAVLVVNVASKCGYTRQYAGLESLYKSYKDKGLIVVGFPSNDFGGQEPGTEEEILQFCTSKYAVTFPLFSKVTVKGDAAHPLFAALTGAAAGAPGPVKWNFNKFLLGKDGTLVQRFDSKVEPESDELKAAIDKALAAAK